MDTGVEIVQCVSSLLTFTPVIPCDRRACGLNSSTLLMLCHPSGAISQTLSRPLSPLHSFFFLSFLLLVLW